MEMTKEEIIRDYRQARYKGKQVGILADLNSCRKSEIVAILREGGVPVKALPRNRATHPQDGKKAAQEGEKTTQEREKAAQERAGAIGGATAPSPIPKHTRVLKLALSEYLAKQKRLLEVRERETEQELVAIRESIREAETALTVLAGERGEENADG